MPTLARTAVGSAVSITTTVAIPSGSYSASADKLALDNSAGALIADFRLTGVTFAAAPVAGQVQLVAVSRDFAGNPGPTPSASLLGRVYNFTPTPSTGNGSTGWILSCNQVPLDAYSDYYILNNNTAQQIATGAILTAQKYSLST